ncbi:hypothetical protein BF93_03445 [Brachybacterium phenoliresistens]|uniref:GPP34 family phosphoprotein n=1 Tax=Brachybacterium phenoliresistens TaxID=396014 RepID=Z9JRQ3_9MICO|nr:GPP34 family phosphoprotein [Brachybacterium phenoliresistens]EWS80437.1 hypothetical protein BF93_03445 [Brachybacterium phenoliresistens]
MTTIARALFLLLTSDAGRSELSVGRREPLVAGAVTDLVLLRRVELEDGKDPRVRVVDATPVGDPALDHVLVGLGELEGKRLSALVGHRRLDPTDLLAEQLVAEGVLEERRGLFGVRVVPVDGHQEEALRAHLAAAVGGEVEPTAGDAAVLGVLRALDVAHRLLRDHLPGVTRRQLRDRIDEISQGVPTLDAVRRSYDAMQAALVATMIVPMVIAGS